MRQQGYTDDQLVQMIQNIDLRDGKLDGKVAKSTERPTCTLRCCALCSIFIHEAEFNRNIRVSPNGLLSTATLFLPAPSDACPTMPIPHLTPILSAGR